MEEQKELWGIGRTFILAILGLFMGFTLILLGMIPADSFLGLLATAVGIYAGKSGIHALATTKKKD